MTAQGLGNLARAGVAFVFPGGGSQYVGMGRDAYEHFPSARRIFEQADAALEFALSSLCFGGPEEALTDTLNAQPATITTSAALLACLREQAGSLVPSFVAGHSTGEYTALLAGGALDFPAVLRLVRERARLMNEAGQRQPGSMAAVLGMDFAALKEICDQVGDVWIANDNAPGQIVLSGRKSALASALTLARERGARRIIPVAVSVASHCPLMAPAADALAAVVEELPLQKATVPIVANVSAQALVEPPDMRRELLQHLTSPVRWVESVRYMAAHGVHTFVEIGPKNVVSGLIKRIDARVQVISIGSIAEMEAVTL